jgi:hypothetical protein
MADGKVHNPNHARRRCRWALGEKGENREHFMNGCEKTTGVRALCTPYLMQQKTPPSDINMRADGVSPAEDQIKIYIKTGNIAYPQSANSYTIHSNYYNKESCASRGRRHPGPAISHIRLV